MSGRPPGSPLTFRHCVSRASARTNKLPCPEPARSRRVPPADVTGNARRQENEQSDCAPQQVNPRPVRHITVGSVADQDAGSGQYDGAGDYPGGGHISEPQTGN